MRQEYESAESDALNENSDGAAQPVYVYSYVHLIFAKLIQYSPTRSIYALTRKEITQGIANRFVHSHTYIFLYLGMAALSVTTVVLSLSDGCPGLSFYILEIIINTSMILEVGVRFIAFGRVGPCLLSSMVIELVGMDSNSGGRQLMCWIFYARVSVQSLYW